MSDEWPGQAVSSDEDSWPGQAVQSDAQAKPSTPDQGRLHAVGHGALAGATFNFGDELAGVRAAAPKVAGYNIPDFLGPIPARTMAGAARLATNYFTDSDPEANSAYEKARDEERQAQHEAKANHPYVYGAGELAGAVPAMAVMPEVGLARGAGLAANLARGAVAGAGYGGLSGLGEGENVQERVGNAASGALSGIVGGVVGATAGHVLGAAYNKFGRPILQGVKDFVAPTTKDLFKAAENNYKNMKGYGVEIHPKAVNEVADNIGNELLNEGYRDYLAPKTFRALEELRNPVGANATISDIEGVRRALNKAGADPAERDAARRAITQIDNSLANLHPNDVVVNPHFADRVSKEAVEARSNYAAAKRSEQIDEARKKAERQANAAGSGTDIDNATRKKIKSLLDNPKKLRGYSDAEKEQMEKIIAGTKVGNAARLLGKFSPSGIVSGGISAGAGLAASGSPLGAVALPALGYAAKKIGDRSTARQVNKLSELIRSRSPIGKEAAIDNAAKMALSQVRKSDFIQPELTGGIGGRGSQYLIPGLQGPMPTYAEDKQN